MGSKSFATILLLAASMSLRAQDRSPRLALQLPQGMKAGTDAPTASLQHMLAEGHRRELLAAGFPAVLHCQVELWKRTFITFSRESAVDWDIIVEFIPATGHYQVKRQQDNKLTELGDLATLDDAEAVVDQPYHLPTTPRSSGARYFYLFAVDLSTLQGSDLEAWQRWVRGEAAPAVRGRANIFTAIKTGLGALMSRLLGGETQHYEVRAPFTAG